MKELTRRCIGSSRFEPNSHFSDAYWATLEDFEKAVDQAIGTYSPESVPADLKKALQELVDLRFVLTCGITQVSTGMASREAVAMAKRLFSSALVQLRMLYRCRIFSSQGIVTWGMYVAELGAHVSRYRQELHPEMDAIAQELDTLAGPRAQGPEKLYVKPVLDCVVPRLHGRRPASPRPKLAPLQNYCSLTLAGASGSFTIVGTIEDICPERYLGFRLKAQGVCLEKDYPQPGLDCRQRLYERFPYWYEIEVHRPGESEIVQVSTVDIEYIDRASGSQLLKHQAFRILRAWREPDGQSAGLAVLAEGEPPPIWRETVDSLPLVGR
jgi:hypothetical protein